MSTVALSNHWYSQKLDPSNSSRIVVLTNQTRVNPAAWNPIPRSASTPCRSGALIVPSACCPVQPQLPCRHTLANSVFPITGEGYKPTLCGVNGQLSVENRRSDLFTEADSKPSRKPCAPRPTTLAAGQGSGGGLLRYQSRAAAHPRCGWRRR